MEMSMAVLARALFFIIAFISVDSVSALTCSYCTSQISMDDCEINSLNSNQCSKDSVCFSASYQMYGALQMHRKGCVHKKSCGKFKLCGSSENDNRCDYKCCDTNYCNTSSWLHSNRNIRTAIVLSIIAFVILKWNLV